jgi:hypothetical protein
MILKKKFPNKEKEETRMKKRVGKEGLKCM